MEHINKTDKQIYLYKKGILAINPIWVALNNGKYKLYFSNPIRLQINQQENTVKMKELFFIHSKKTDIDIEKGNVLTMQITKLDRRLRIGIIIVSLLVIAYLFTDWEFIPNIILLCALFGYMLFSVIFLLISKRKDYFEIQQD